MKLRPFELALVIIFVVLGLAALALLASYDGGSSGPKEGEVVTGPVQIWGTMPGSGMQTVLDELVAKNETYKDVSYRYIAPAQFEQTLTNALADSRGPDIILTSHEELVDSRSRIAPYSYEQFPLRDVRDRYIEGAQIYALSDGVYALPIAVDPMVLFWNRDILATEGYLAAPSTWEELINVQFNDLIQRDFDRTIRRGVVAMGEYNNVRNAFGLVSMLLMQSGSQGVADVARGYEINLNRSINDASNPLRTVADFYTRFSRPANTLYSWNRSFAEDRNEFIGEDLVFYFGYASEGPVLERLNPNLNLDISEVPQGAAASVRRTYGRFYGLSLLRSTDNPNGAYSVMGTLGGSSIADRIAIGSDLTPVTRQTVAAGSNTTYGRISYQSAAIAYGWLNPDPDATDIVFATMMEDINENRSSVDGATGDTIDRLGFEY
jgi:ABC-type glycerol-3-phosphate transport system substrate-binding protein